MVSAYDRQPRFGGKQIAVIRLTCTPYFEATGIMPEVDYAGEGFEFYDQNPHLLPKMYALEADETMLDRFRAWQRVNVPLWVVRFQLEELAKGDQP